MIVQKILYIVLLLSSGIFPLCAQTGHYKATPQTALDFLTFPMDARSAAMGETGVGTPADNYAHFYNPGKYLFIKQQAGISISYSPWLRNLVNDMNISSLSGFYVINSFQSVSASFRYFSMGDMELTRPEETDPWRTSSPFQLSLDVAYARKLSRYLSASVAFRYVLADLYPSDETYKKGQGVAADLSFFFHKRVDLFGRNTLLSIGTSLSNVGTKISFYRGGTEYFMPMTFKLGGGINVPVNEEHNVGVNVELTRSLVPIDPGKQAGSAISAVFDSIGEGKSGSIIWGVGMEYDFKELLFGRIGYYHEGKNREERKNLSFGAGLSYKIAHVDMAYIVPVDTRYNAMGNTLRLSMSVNL